MKPATKEWMAIGVCLFAFACVLGFCHGCAGGVPREGARAALLTTARAVDETSDACARHALVTDDLDLAKKCQAGYDAARLALIATASGVDAWEKPESRASVTCAVRTASTELAGIVSEMRQRSARVPAVAQDALALVSLLAPCVEVSE